MNKTCQESQGSYANFQATGGAGLNKVRGNGRGQVRQRGTHRGNGKGRSIGLESKERSSILSGRSSAGSAVEESIEGQAEIIVVLKRKLGRWQMRKKI